MRILYIDHYAGSDSLGMEFRPYYLAREWNKMGHDVTVLAADCSHLRTVNPDVKQDFEEQIIDDNVRFCWVRSTKYTNGHSLKRYINMYSFKGKIERNAQMLAEKYKPDAVIASSTYPMDIYAAERIAKISGARLCFEIHDLWPLTLIVIYHLPTWFFATKIIQRGEDRAFCSSDVIVSVLPNADKHLAERGADTSKFVYIPNGINLDSPREKMPQEHELLFKRLKKEEKFVVLYAGGHTATNELDTFLASASSMPENVALVMVGDGHLKPKLMERANDENLKNVYFLPSVKKTQVFSVLEKGDCLYIGAKQCRLYQYGVAMNKLFDYMLAAKPIIYGVEASNNPVTECNCGITISASNSAAIAGAVVKLMSLPQEELTEMGNRAHAYVLANHNYKILAEKFIDALKGDEK